MTFGPLLILVLALGLAWVVTWSRRVELQRMARAVRERQELGGPGAPEARLQQPIIDLSRCLGCGKCVDVCPEDGVLALVHGQAAVVNAARCVGVANCARECPVGAITVTLAGLETRRDVPAQSASLEAIGREGLFLAGEVTAQALIKTAVDHGVAVAAEVGRRCSERPTPAGLLDLLIVGAGPAGLACALEAKRLGLAARVLDQEAHLGGTVARYPRRKLVITLPVDLPLYGRLASASYEKEQLIGIWEEIAARHALDIRLGEELLDVVRQAGGTFLVRTRAGEHRARFVCLAIGRRGVPNRLGVPGENLPKVAHWLLDAHSYQGRKLLVVGGGDAAIETALVLAEQPGNEVTVSYRRERFFRIRARTEERLARAVALGRLRVLYGSEVVAIGPDDVELRAGDRSLRLANDEVFVMAGGVPPIALLERAGVSFDPSLRPPPAPIEEQGTGALRALAVGLGLAIAALAFALWHSDYYALPIAERATHDKHSLLRPAQGLGLWLGVAAAALIAANLLYLLRRAARHGARWGSLRAWMTSHVATGILALLCALLHAALAPRDTPGGHAFWALVVLFVTGAIGRYLYAYVPRAVNGRELVLAEVKAELARVSSAWDQVPRPFEQETRQRLLACLEARQWGGTFLGRLLALLGLQLGFPALLRGIRRDGRRHGIAEADLDATLLLARRAFRSALMVAHYEDLRAILATWRYLHRWVAALLVLLVIVHVVHALAYGAFFTRGGTP